ncbi:MAG: hypothetical protein ACREM8_07385 [Vulcanimicrobiaceae bacterium]
MSARTKDDAWGTPATDEPRWPASVAVLIAAAVNFTLPARYTLGPSWLVPILVLAILIPLTIVAPRRVPGESRARQAAGMIVIALVNIANIGSLALLVHRLVFNGKTINGSELLYSSAGIWLTNVIVFALWYWELDRGGPDERLKRQHTAPDFLFPQMVTPGCTHAHWSPNFIDYAYVAFTNATAFSPTDTMPLTPTAKMLMLVQSIASLLTITLVAARAVNILN